MTPHFLIDGVFAMDRKDLELDKLTPEELARVVPVTCQYLIDGGWPHFDH